MRQRPARKRRWRSSNSIAWTMASVVDRRAAPCKARSETISRSTGPSGPDTTGPQEGEGTAMPAGPFVGHRRAEGRPSGAHRDPYRAGAHGDGARHAADADRRHHAVRCRIDARDRAAQRIGHPCGASAEGHRARAGARRRCGARSAPGSCRCARRRRPPSRSPRSIRRPIASGVERLGERPDAPCDPVAAAARSRPPCPSALSATTRVAVAVTASAVSRGTRATIAPERASTRVSAPRPSIAQTASGPIAICWRFVDARSPRPMSTVSSIARDRAPIRASCDVAAPVWALREPLEPLPTQTAFAPAAIPVGSRPVAKLAAVRVVGSIRDSVRASAFSDHTAPPPTTTSDGV